ncbi:erg26, C-3 sterol dehydrogenase [Ciborinia camelliae]|nr:erg26, C-3 sterol dehydrogenase [Ciborinia camelliae]
MAMKTSSQDSQDSAGGDELLSILVIGGCGFVGYHLVHHFVENATFSAVAVASRSANHSKNRISGASYHDVDLTDNGSIENLIDAVKPTVIIHAASPSPVTGTPKDYDKVTIQGTKDLLRIAKKSTNVQALIYTSSSLLYTGPKHINLTEESLLADSDPKAPAYGRSKALAEKLVLNANEPLPIDKPIKKAFSWEGYLYTGALRFPIIYGTHDLICIPGALNALQKGRTNVVLGDDNNLWSFCSVENAAVSHLLLARALLDTHKRRSSNLTTADGEAFNIHDGESHKFWDFARMIWEFAGHKPKNERIFYLPTWFALVLSSCLELVFWIFTFGNKRPYQLGKQQVEYALFEHTYSIEKARKVLEYEPNQDFERGLRAAVIWSLEHDGWAKRLERAVST